MSSLLIVVLDLESLLAGIKAQCKDGRKEFNLDYVADVLSSFCTSFGLMQRNNRLAIIAFHTYGTDIILPDQESLLTQTRPLDFSMSLPDIASKIKEGLNGIIQSYIQALNENGIASIGDTSRLSSALSNSLTIINRVKQQENIDSRILLLQFDPDIPQNYNSVMNCIFSATKLEVMIDAVIVANNDSHLMQQACFLSGGIYKRMRDWSDLLLVLQSHFLADRATRRLLTLPSQGTVDFKASCFCHKQPREFTYMCSVCLTLVCDIPAEACIVCGTPVRSK